MGLEIGRNTLVHNTIEKTNQGVAVLGVEPSIALVGLSPGRNFTWCRTSLCLGSSIVPKHGPSKQLWGEQAISGNAP